jgi:hypothetical protein
MVPQKRYEPQISADRRRHVDGVNLEPSIHFIMKNPDEEGIPLGDAMGRRFARLVARDDPMFQTRGRPISICLNVSFVPRGFCCHVFVNVPLVLTQYKFSGRVIHLEPSDPYCTRDFRNPRRLIARAELAENVAYCVDHFIVAVRVILYESSTIIVALRSHGLAFFF